MSHEVQFTRLADSLAQVWAGVPRQCQERVKEEPEQRQSEDHNRKIRISGYLFCLIIRKDKVGNGLLLLLQGLFVFLWESFCVNGGRQQRCWGEGDVREMEREMKRSKRGGKGRYNISKEFSFFFWVRKWSKGGKEGRGKGK